MDNFGFKSTMFGSFGNDSFVCLWCSGCSTSFLLAYFSHAFCFSSPWLRRARIASASDDKVITQRGTDRWTHAKTNTNPNAAKSRGNFNMGFLGSDGRLTSGFLVSGDPAEFDPERWPTGRLPKRDPETHLKVLIIGAGLAGLVTALECWRKGHNVVGILERSNGPMYAGK